MEKSKNDRDIRIRPASEADLPSILSLLSSASLHVEDVAQHWRTFLVAQSGDSMVGSVGLEVSGPKALLRSLAVEESLRGTGLGKRLCDEAESLARSMGAQELGLLTVTAEKFFAHRGYKKVAAAEIPAFVKSTYEFRFLCPSTAVCMTKAIG